MRDIPLSSLHYVIIDFETTGLKADDGDEVIELGAIKVEGKKVSERTLHSLVNPQRDIPPSASAVHGITKEHLKDAPTAAEVVRREHT